MSYSQTYDKNKLHWISSIYRPPYSNRHPTPTSTFIDEFPDHISHLLCQTDNLIIVGDINIPWNKTDNIDTICLTEILELYNLKQHVASPTHKQGNTIDWVMNVKNTEDFLDLHTNEFLSDHCTTEWLININRTNTVKTRSMIRDLKKINQEEFARDLDLDLNKNTHDRQPLQGLYDGFISSIETTHYMHINKYYLRYLYQSKKSYINTQLESNNNSQVLFQILQQLTKGQHDNPLPDCSSHEELANNFTDFFIDKIEKIRSQFPQSKLYTPPSWKCKNLTQFRPIGDEEALKILNSMKKTTCDVDPCNINFLIEFKGILLRTWTKIINKSLLSDSFLQSWKKAIIRPLIKSSKLHRNSKIIEPSVTCHSSPNQLKRLPSFNSPHSLKTKTYCPPTKVPTANTTQQRLQY